MAAIRIGFIGLSATSSWAVVAHLPYLKSTSRYQITGVCNSSVESSRAAIEAHGLEATAKPYGSVAELASSPDVDLVVCAVRVDRHYECLKPVIAAGKDCFVEWPLASNLAQATELEQLAERRGIRTMIGLQGQMSPVVSRIRELVTEQAAIGRVVSSSINLAGSIGDSKATEGNEYLNYAETGGNMTVIPFGHICDSLFYILGELQSLSATLSVQMQDLPITSADGSRQLKTVRRTTADQVTVSGLLESGAQLSATAYGGAAFEGEPALLWYIRGTKGTLEVRGQQTFAISMSGDVKARLQLHDSGKVEEIELQGVDEGPSGNVGRLYEAFAGNRHVPDWKWALRRHSWIGAIYKSHETGRRTAYR